MLLFVALSLISNMLDAIIAWDSSIEYLNLIERIENNHRSQERIVIGDVRMGNDKNNYSPSPFKEKHYLFYDSHNLYYTVIAEIDSSFSRGVETVRDGDTVSDEIYLHLITQPESHIAYVYVFSPLECKKDYTLILTLDLIKTGTADINIDQNSMGICGILKQRYLLTICGIRGLHHISFL